MALCFCCARRFVPAHDSGVGKIELRVAGISFSIAKSIFPRSTIDRMVVLKASVTAICAPGRSMRKRARHLPAAVRDLLRYTKAYFAFAQLCGEQSPALHHELWNSAPIGD
jgi:hypothetical protein